ncbi:hypothetical protein TEA_019402 [Camellia sinensis var. sinensis]|uniref:Pyrrolo-quinoline quinone repeat domain-containing protein n=1 Tax=Camellia sinensis var. sinensis TaxID=542762 RepID=A0A4S4DTJ8_CAMSN|nr:hypothetical protein TEA_019402 [Camellia sinensis var. sinensis]
MPIQSILIFFFIIALRSALVASQPPQFPEYPSNPHLFSVKGQTARRLSKPLIRDDGKIYSCSERNLFAFESNGSIAWTVNLNYICNVGIAPIHGGSRKIFLVAENKVLRINPLNIGTSESAVEVFFGSEAGDEEGEIIGLSVSMLSSSVFINVKNKGIFAYRLQGQLLWIAGPLLYQSGYRQGCRKNDKDCYFTSTPVIDQCEATIYISNTEGELYALLVRSPRFKWIQDFSSLDKSFTITPGNNGLLYVTVPVRALVLALDVSTGTVLWQRSIGPLSWISIGSLDGFLYSFSPIGVPKKFPKAAALDSVVQVSPLLDCSGYAVYISQTEMEGKINHTIAEYTYISSMKPRNAVFTLLVPATGSIYWSESYSGQKLASSCSHAEPNRVNIHTGNARVVVFLLFESVILMVLVTVVRFCCLFWRKKKLQGQDLGKFLEKRRLLQLQKKAFDRTITEIKQKTAEEAVENEMIEKLGDLVRDKQDIERKLSTTYSLGRDRTGSKSKSLLPLYDGKTKSYSFQGSKKENVTIFHTLSDTSSAESSSEKEVELNFYENKELAVKAKTKAPMKVDSASDDEIKEECEGTPSGSASGSKGFMNPLFLEDAFVESKEVKRHGGAEVREAMHSGNRSIRRRTLSSTD